ncbi:hypothetical protein [Pseudomonas oligotrophica]|uniref:hypothetical protein n=1 Tax=Pseudomonas oligotrophica TaxID=2912055 RepID=UPI001F1D0AFE|nr:hypothetical protein [Pseudomonas oligotrophica]MCF7200837.1 hypothetical protein [Pseudomonas oligotrophica]
MSSTLNRFIQCLPWNQPIELPDHHQWKHANQHALLEWEIKARPYNTKIANGMFAFLLCITLIFSYFLLYKNAGFNLTETAFIAVPGFFLFFLALHGTTHQKTKFAYRLTETGIEVCEWNAPGKGWLIALKWLTVIASIAVIFVVALDPSAFWVALAGPGGMGLLYLGLANSSKFQEMHAEYHHRGHEWERYKKISIHTGRPVIGLQFDYFNTHLQTMDKGILFLFCKKQQLATALREISRKRPDLKPINEPFDIY